MGRQIIEQPNGKFCIFSSVVDNVTYYDLTETEIVDLWVEEFKKEIEKSVSETIAKLKNKGKPYSQLTKSYDDMLRAIKEIHGIKESKDIKKLIEKT